MPSRYAWASLRPGKYAPAEIWAGGRRVIVERAHVAAVQRRLHLALTRRRRTGIEPVGVVRPRDAHELEPEPLVVAAIEAGEAEVHDPDLPVDLGGGDVADPVVVDNVEPDGHHDHIGQLVALTDCARRELPIFDV